MDTVNNVNDLNDLSSPSGPNSPSGAVEAGAEHERRWSRARVMSWALRGTALTALCVVVAALPPTSAGGIVLPLVIEVAALLVFGLAVLRSRAQVWALLWASMLLVVAGDLVYAYQDNVADVVPFPGWADWLYLASYLPQGAAIVLLVRARHTRRSLPQALDTAIMCVPAVTVTMVYVVTPIVTEEAWSLDTLVSVIYPLADLAILTGLMRLLVGGGRTNRAVMLLAASTVTTLIADLLYSGLVVQGLVDEQPGWVQGLFTAGVLLMTAAALSSDAGSVATPAPSARRRLMSPARSTALAVASLALPVMVVLGLGTGESSDPVALALGAVVVNVLIAWRVTTLLNVIRTQRDELDRLARTDSLTGLPNRRSWDFHCKRVQDSLAPDDLVVVAMLDLDRFKDYNDTHGHQRGDAILLDCARRWSEALPRDAYLARYGGEEFALLLPVTSTEAGEHHLEAVRLATPKPMTVSLGYAVVEHGQPVAEALTAADRALYRAKAQGRDRVVADDGGR